MGSGPRRCFPSTFALLLLFVAIATWNLHEQAISFSALHGSGDQTARFDLPYSMVKSNNNSPQTDNPQELTHVEATVQPNNLQPASKRKPDDNGHCAGREWAQTIVQAPTRQFKNRCRDFPTMESVAAIYGAEPVIYGLDTCAQFRENVKQATSEHEGKRDSSTAPTARVAGLFQTGTNAMAVSLGRNLNQFYLLKRPKSPLWLVENVLVPWRKHVPPHFRNVSKLTQDQHIDLRVVLPVVMVRDPYWWIQSMCKESYDAIWTKRTDRCPNIVTDSGINEISVKWERLYPMKYPSIVALWNDWIQEYVDADFPRLIVRFEDQFFHAEQVMKAISECSGVQLRPPFQYHTGKAKKHGHPNSFMEAIKKYSSTEGRRSGIDDPVDLQFVDANLDPNLMDMFGYKLGGD